MSANDFYSQEGNQNRGQQQPQNQYTEQTVVQEGPVDPNNPDGERGIMGATAGFATGAYGAHKFTNGGFWKTAAAGLASGYAGSKLEDEYKDHHHKNQHEGPGQGQYGQQPPQQHHGISGFFHHDKEGGPDGPPPQQQQGNYYGEDGRKDHGGPGGFGSPPGGPPGGFGGPPGGPPGGPQYGRGGFDGNQGGRW